MLRTSHGTFRALGIPAWDRAGVAAGIKENDGLDLGLVVNTGPARGHRRLHREPGVDRNQVQIVERLTPLVGRSPEAG